MPSQPEAARPQPWYRCDKQEVLNRLATTESGLDSAEARDRLARTGPNALAEKPSRPLWWLLLSQFRDFMILVLLAAALVSGLVGEPEDAIAILVIVILNAIVGSVQEFRAERAIAALHRMAAPEAWVVRDGVTVSIDTRELVPGDMVVLQAGNIVPADIRLLDVEKMQVDESALTGESTGVAKREQALDDENLSPADQRNMAFKGSLVTNGNATGLRWLPGPTPRWAESPPCSRGRPG